MNSESLAASAAINIGLALIVLTLFSLLRKRPSNAPIYYARGLSHRRRPPDSASGRFLPSFGWITRGIFVAEEEILDSCGLDALILIRLFKFGIRYFLVCSAVGLLILLPVNYKAGIQDAYSMDVFTISNVGNNSNCLWVHCAGLYFLSGYGLYLLYKEYYDLLHKRIHQLYILRHQPSQFTVLVRDIPLCDEHKARDCAVHHFFSKYHPHSYQSYQILYDGKDLEKLLSNAKSVSRKIEELRQQSSPFQSTTSFPLLESSKKDAEKVKLKESLRELSHKIRMSQSKQELQKKELPVAFVTFKYRWGAALAAQSQQTPNPLVWITEMAPEPRDVLWRNLSVPYKYIPLYKSGVYVAASLLTIFFAVPVAAVQGIAKFERLEKWFPPAMVVKMIPRIRSVVTGYLPSAILNGCVFVVPFAMIEMVKFAGYPSKSRKDIKTCNMVFYFLVGNVFFLSLLSGSLLEQIGETFTHPKDVPSRLATAASSQADFFITYILTNGLSGFSLEILQPGLLIWDAMKSKIWQRGKPRRPYLYSLPYYRIIPYIALCNLIGMVYAVVSPLILPFLVVYFSLGYIVFVNQIQDVYITTYETCGQYWPYIHHYILTSIVIMQITTIGIFGLKSKPAAAVAIVPLLVFTLLFNEYCKTRFLPTFFRCSVKDARDRDECDERSDTMDANLRNALDAYSPPCLQPMDIG
ncbi:hypothetical protein M569_09324, partial [Genlisea aurea]